MGYVYKGRAVLPDSLSMMHSQIARGLGLDIALVKKTFPENRRAEAEELFNEMELITSQTPPLWSIAGIANGLVGLALMPVMDSDVNRLLVGSLAIGLCAASHIGGNSAQNAKAEAARHDVMKKFTLLATGVEAAPIESAPRNPNPVPWREDNGIDLFAR